MSVVKKVCLKNPHLIRLRNGLRGILYNKYYETLAEIRVPRRRLSDICYNIKMELELEGKYEWVPTDDVKGDLSLSGDFVIKDLVKFADDIENCGLGVEDLYKECRRKIVEVTRYEQALERFFQRSIITCGFSLCRHVSHTDMYLIPDLGVNHRWNRMWVCPEHFEYYRHDIIVTYGVDICSLASPIKLKQKTPQELERLYGS